MHCSFIFMISGLKLAQCPQSRDWLFSIKNTDPTGSVSDLCLVFKLLISRPGQVSFWWRYYVVFLSPPRQISGQNIKLSPKQVNKNNFHQRQFFNTVFNSTCFDQKKIIFNCFNKSLKNQIKLSIIFARSHKWPKDCITITL